MVCRPQLLAAIRFSLSDSGCGVRERLVYRSPLVVVRVQGSIAPYLKVTRDSVSCPQRYENPKSGSRVTRPCSSRSCYILCATRCVIGATWGPLGVYQYYSSGWWMTVVKSRLAKSGRAPLSTFGPWPHPVRIPAAETSELNLAPVSVVAITVGPRRDEIIIVFLRGDCILCQVLQ